MALENGQSTASVYGSATESQGHGSARYASRDITHTEKHDFIQGEIYAKRQWLEKFEAIADDYRRAAERQRA